MTDEQKQPEPSAAATAPATVVKSGPATPATPTEKAQTTRRVRTLAEAPRWRQALESSSAWREQTQGLDVEYREHGVRIADLDARTAAALRSVVLAVLPPAGYPAPRVSAVRGFTVRLGEE